MSINIDPILAGQFKNFEIDPYGVAEVAEAMGAPEAIERRLEANVGAQRNLAISYLGKKIYSRGREAQGLAYSPYRSRRGGYQPAYLQVSPVSLLKSLVEDDRYGRENPSFLTIDERLARSVEATTKHEISHFVDVVGDPLHNPDLSVRQIKKLRKSIDKEQKTAASSHPLVIAKKEQLVKLLPGNRILARAKTNHALIMRQVLGNTGKKLGLNVYPAPLSIGGLASAIEWYEHYDLWPTEILARTDAMLFEEIGRFCCVELKEKPVSSRNVSILDMTEILARPSSTKTTNRR